MINLVDSAFYEIKDNLIVRALLDPSMDLGSVSPSHGQTVGSLNKQALVNRVKKLDDDTRLELMSELNRILHLLRNDQKVGPLQEKGLCVVLLTNDGTQASPRGFFDKICQMFRNYCGYSASSQTIVNKISEVQTELQRELLAEGFEAPKDQMTLQQIGGALKSRVEVMHQKQSDVEASIAEKNAQFECLKTHLYGLKSLMPSEGFDLAETTRFVNKINEIGGFIANDAELVKSSMSPSIKIQSIIQCICLINNHSCNLLVKELQKNDLPLTKSEKNELSSLNDKTQFSQEQISFLRKLVLSVASRNIEGFIDKIDIELVKKKKESLKNMKLIELVKSRQILLSNNESGSVAACNRNIACQEVNALRIKNRESSITEKVLQRICDSVDVLLNESIEIDSNVINLSGIYEEFRNFVNTYKQLISHGIDKDLKNTHNYLVKLVYVSTVLNRETHMLEEMANSINLDKYLPLSQSDPTQRDLYNKLKPFVTQKAAFPLETDEDKKALASAYLNYLKILFRAEKNVLSNEIAERDACIIRINNTPSLQLQYLNSGFAASSQQPPVVPVQPLEVTVKPIDQLKGSAKTLYHIHFNDPQRAKGIYQRLNESPLNMYAATVYRNFYHIMERGDHIENNSGKSWGEFVFHSTDLTHVKNITPEQLNQYRAKAMYLASIGQNVYDKSSFHHNNIVPPL